MSTLLLRTRAQLAGLDSLRGGRPLVLVPTMGALHEGHLSLVDCGSRLGPVVVSIFVNPTQFGPEEDLDAYPRDLAGDLALLEGRKVAAVFAPDVADMYGEAGEVSVAPGRRAAGLCGAARPDHFRGVLTVVAKLFGLVSDHGDAAVDSRGGRRVQNVIQQGPTFNAVQDLGQVGFHARSLARGKDDRLDRWCLSFPSFFQFRLLLAACAGSSSSRADSRTRSSATSSTTLSIRRAGPTWAATASSTRPATTSGTASSGTVRTTA